MNILLLAPFLPYPLDQGGKIRIFNIIKNLSQSHSITLAAVVDRRNAADEAPLRELCDEVIVVERPARLWPDRFSFFCSNSPYNVIRYHSQELEQTLKELSQRKKFDAVQIEFTMMWQYARLFKRIPVSLDAHNIEHHNVQQIGDTKQSLFWRMMYLLEEKRLRDVEERAWRECALCFAVSDKERDEIAARCGDEAKVVTAANGVEPDRFRFVPERKGNKKILFLGGMDYAPNLDAATYFLTDIFPKILTVEKGAKVLLVGRELAKLGELAKLPGVEVHESVPDVVPFFYDADVLAVPLRQGAGTRIKVLEAMAAGLPVVTTGKGCEGINMEKGNCVLRADSAEEFVKAVLDVLADVEIARTLAENAHRLVLQCYTWQQTAEAMSEEYKRVSQRET